MMAKIIQARLIGKAEAKKDVLSYIKGNPNVYPSDVAVALGLDLRLVMAACQRLFKEKKLELAE